MLAAVAYAYRHRIMEAAGLRNAFGQNSGAFLRAELPCPAQTDKTLVAVVLGQSNAGSSAQGKSLALPNVINFFEGGCFLAEDPLLGTDGRGASPWIPFANGLAPGHDHVIVAPFTVGDSSIRRWDGDIGAQLARTLKTIASKYRVTHFLWQQGESDGEMSAGEYATHLRKVIALTRSAFPASSFHVAIASRCGNSPADNGVRAGQSAVIDPKAGIFQGPDTDVIIERYDACHFSDSGRLEAARLWLKAIIQPNG